MAPWSQEFAVTEHVLQLQALAGFGPSTISVEPFWNPAGHGRTRSFDNATMDQPGGTTTHDGLFVAQAAASIAPSRGLGFVASGETPSPSASAVLVSSPLALPTFTFGRLASWVLASTTLVLEGSP
jgi:hypothetical protein